jgi:hypothetical protein
MPMSIGQGSGDFRETSARVQIFHVGIRNSLGVLTADAFTQNNPGVIPTYPSTTLAGISKKGVLGGSVAFTRPDAGNGFHGGPVQVAAAYVAAQRPLGIYINDAIGNAFENTPGVASGRGPYLCNGGTLGVSIWETQNQASGAALTYAVGDKLYASANGLLTNLYADSYEGLVTGQTASFTFGTLIGIVKVAPDANNSLLVFDLRI